MLPIAILTLFATVILLVFFRLANRRVVWHWLAALVGGLVAWILILLARLGLPHTHTLLAWQMPYAFSDTLTLRLDSISWPFALALVTLPPAVVVTAVARRSPLYWRPWASTLLMTAGGLVAVCAGDALTLIFAWSALDFVEILVLFAQGRQMDLARNAALTFAGRSLGIGLMLMAILAAQVDELAWNLAFIPSVVAPYLLLAAGLRLGVLPFNAPFYFDEIAIRRGLGSALRLIPAASSLMLLTRTAVTGIPLAGWVAPEFPLQTVALGLATLSALVGATAWAAASDEMAGRLFWLLGTGSLTTAAAALAMPEAALAWGLAGLLGGGLIFLHSIRGRGLWLLPLLSALLFSGLPFTPGWNTALLYQASWPWLALFGVAHGLLLLGFVRHSLRPDYGFDRSQRWVGVLYVAGLSLLLVAQIVTGMLLPQPDTGSAWWGGALAVSIAAGLGAVSLLGSRRGWGFPVGMLVALRRFFSLNWLYRLLGFVYRLAQGLMALISRLLEGDGGLLWVFILVGMLVTLYLSVGGVLEP